MSRDSCRRGVRRMEYENNDLGKTRLRITHVHVSSERMLIVSPENNVHSNLSNLAREER